MKRYSALELIRQGLGGHRGWDRVWRKPEPKESYDAVIIGGGGHGLATAYYLAKLHGMTNIAVIEKGWIGGGNSGRNTTIIRSNYLFDESAAIYNHALDLWKGLGQELNCNIRMSHRGVLNLAHDEGEMRQLKRRVEANRLNGVDSEWLDATEVKNFCPSINISGDLRYPVLGGTLHRSRREVRSAQGGGVLGGTGDALQAGHECLHRRGERLECTVLASKDRVTARRRCFPAIQHRRLRWFGFVGRIRVPHAAEVRSLVRFLDDHGDLGMALDAFGKRIGHWRPEQTGHAKVGFRVKILVAEHQYLVIQECLVHGFEG